MSAIDAVMAQNGVKALRAVQYPFPFSRGPIDVGL